MNIFCNGCVQVKAYALTDWRLSDYKQIAIELANADKIIFDGSLQQHRDFVESLMPQIGALAGNICLLHPMDCKF